MGFDRSKFIAQFKAETREHLQKISNGLLKLEKSPRDKELLEELMRQAHTIKGSATMMGYKRIAELAHALESGFELALSGKAKIERPQIDVVFKSLDAIEPLLEDKLVWEDKGVQRPFTDDLCRQIEAVFSGKPLKKEKKTAPLPAALSAKGAALPEETIRVDIEKLDKLMNLSGELLISKERLDNLTRSLLKKIEAEPETQENFQALAQELKLADENIDLLTANMQEEVMKARMVSVAQLFNIFPRAMRDLALAKGKEIELELKGEDTQLDKAIIDELKDPLMHILRNCVDHGIETPEERRQKGKQACGKITLKASEQSRQVILEVSDDGRGIDSEKVRREAVSKGLASEKKAAELSTEELYQFLFLPGFSTAAEVTETSGRGVGLDVVREKIAALKGVVDLVSVAGAGTTIILKVPLTLAITESLIASCGSEIFAIPVEAVVENIRISGEDIKSVENKEAVSLRAQILPLVRLNDIFGLQEKGIIEKKYFSVVVVQSAEKRIALLVDQLLGRQEIVRKSLGEPLKNVRDIAGATILGDGRVILILDIPAVIASCEGAAVRRPQVEARPAPAVKKKKTILLAEDALTTAMLEKNILEGAGFSVVIARDGKEAMDKAGQEKFDLVITDILMPRMDGFELTSRLKKDEIYKEVPVIIVTTRESEADKRKGLVAGADAYILKSEFTSEGLLETIERLIG